MPATTCALVITRWLAITNPVPSSEREQDGAVPRTLSTLGRTRSTTSLPLSRASGGSTPVIGVWSNRSTAAGKPDSSSRFCRSSDRFLAACGMAESTVPSTRELLMAEASVGSPAASVSGSAISQATTNTTAPCTSAPSALSTPRSGVASTRCLIARPTYTPSVSPSATNSTTMPTANATLAATSVNCSTTSGASRMPSTAPASTPANAGSAVTMPCRAPDTAASNASATTSRSTQFTPAPPGQCSPHHDTCSTTGTAPRGACSGRFSGPSRRGTRCVAAG